MIECAINFNAGLEKPSRNGKLFVPFGRLDLAQPEQFLKAVRMVAACWGCANEADREFETTWRPSSKSGEGYCLVDVGDGGVYSLRIEGLYARYLAGYFGIRPPLVSAEQLGLDTSTPPAIVKVTFARNDWDPTVASPADWEALRVALTEVATARCEDFFSYDVTFAHLAIDWLKANKGCIPLSCDDLPPLGWMAPQSQ